VRLRVTVPRELGAAIRKLAVTRGASISAVLAEVIASYLRSIGPNRRRQRARKRPPPLRR